MKNLWKSACTMLGIAAVFAAPARAQCPAGWRAGPSIPATQQGVDNTVRCSVSWDPDGAGPNPPLLVIGGSFTTMASGAFSAPRIAAWNGASWQGLSTGIGGGSPVVYSLAVFNNELIAAGTFTNAGGVAVNNIARWNGSVWQPLGTGLTAAGTVSVRALAVYQGQLYATGSFSTAGGVSASGMARWNGSSWSALPVGGTGGYAMCVYNNELYVGGNGSFNQSLPVHRFNGTSWFTTPSGLVGTIDANDNFPFIRAMVVHNNKLVIAGNFENAGPFPNCNGIATWDATASTWGPLGFGMDKPVHALAVLNGTLYAGGSFNTASAALATRVARWNGSNWNGAATSIGGSSTWVATLAVHEGDVYAGGFFTSLGGTPASNIARLGSSGSWLALFNSTPVRVFSGALTAGGDFTVNLGGGVIANRCVGWSGSALGAFSDLGGFTGPNGPVHALGSYSTNPFVVPYTVFGGTFTSAGGTTANDIATWRLSTWGTMSTGFGGTVRALATYNGQLYAAGDFLSASGNPCNRIARYVSGTWQPLGTGLNGSAYCMFVSGGVLYVGGTFTNAGGVNTNYVATWNGTSWGGIADGFSSNGAGSGVYSIASMTTGITNRLIFGGRFATNINFVRNLCYSDGIVAFLRSFGGDITGTVRAMAVHEGDLYVGGDLTATPAGAVKYIAGWNPSTGWYSLGTGVDSTVYALRSAWGSELHVGGAFATAGGINSPHWAVYNPTGRPAITQNPSSQTALGCDATFSVTVPASYAGATYQWLYNGSPISNGVNINGAVISGATSPTLTMTGLSNADEGVYSCQVSNACSASVTAAATLTVCGADVNCDGFVDALDYDTFINGWLTSNLSADYNRDGFTDAIDYDGFINDFLASC